MNVHFIARLRNERKFDSPQALAAQLQQDKEHGLRVLSER
jgi:FAD synthase